MSSHKQITNGFSLLELLIAIAIVAVLAAVAIPSYLQHLREGEFKETVDAANALKQPVTACIERNKGVANCIQGTHAIPAAVVVSATKPGVTVNAGEITAISATTDHYGVANSTYILTPIYTASSPVKWIASGGGCDKKYVHCKRN